MASADTENAGGVHATGNAPNEPLRALENQLDTLLQDAAQTLQAFEQVAPEAPAEPVSGDVPGPPIDQPFDLAALSAELEGALRQAETVAREEREAERQAIDITPEAIVAVAVSATTASGEVGPDGEALPLIDLEALDDALAQAADAVGFGLGGDELDPPRAERIEQMSRLMEPEPEPAPLEAPAPAPEIVEQIIPPTPMMRHAKVLANAANPHTEVATEPEVNPAPADVVEPASAPIAEPQIQAVEAPPAPVEAIVEPTVPEPAAYEVPAPVAGPEPAPEPIAPPAPKRAPEKPAPSVVEAKPNPLIGAVDGVLRAIAAPLTMMSPAVRDLVGWLGLLTAFNAACVWVFVILVGPGNWPTASAHASGPDAHAESADDGHGAPAKKDAGHGAPAKKDSGHGAPPKKDAGHGAPAKKDSGHGASAKKKDAGHGAPAKKPSPHAPPKSKKKDSGHGGH